MHKCSFFIVFSVASPEQIFEAQHIVETNGPLRHQCSIFRVSQFLGWYHRVEEGLDQDSLSPRKIRHVIILAL